MLSLVLHIGDLYVAPISGNWAARNKMTVSKVCTIIGISEKEFQDVIAEFGSKETAEVWIKELGREIYKMTFKWARDKINMHLFYYQ